MFNDTEKKLLKDIAKKSIEYGLQYKKPYIPDLKYLPSSLLEKRASFVTLLIKNLPSDRNLRGCIGSIFTEYSLAEDVARNAFSAAFEDPRFLPLKKEELNNIEIKISILSPLIKMNVKNLEDLYNKIEEKKHGIFLKSSAGKSTFLPDVWEKIPNKEVFIKELYRKAQIPLDFPFSKIEWYQYTTESI